MADQRTMAQLLQASTEGYEDAIVVPAITANYFELKHGLFTLVQNKQFFGHDKEDPHAHVSYFNKITSTLKFPNVLNTMVKALLLDKKSQNQSPAPVKAVEEICVTCGGAHSYCNCPATDGNVYRDNIQEFVSQAFVVNYNQGNTSYRPPMMSNQIRPPGFPPCLYFEMCTIPSNTIANPRSDLKAITTRSGVSYDGPQISPSTSFLPKVVENEPEATKDTVNPTNNGNTEDVQPQMVQSESSILNSEPVTSLISEPAIASVSTSKPNPKASIPYPSRRNDERNREKANNQIEKFYQIFKDTSFEISFADALILMPKFASTLKALIRNKEKLSEMARMAECLALTDLDANINLMPFFVWKRLSLPDLTRTCMTLELADRSISRLVGVAEDVCVKVGSFHFSADFVVVDFDADLRVPLILERSFLKTERALIDVFKSELTLRVGKEAITFNLDQTSRYSVNYSDMTKKRIDVIDMALDEPPVVELKDLPPHLEYAFLEGDDKLPVIIAKDLSMEEKTALIK
nr:reverse transcriptase domain-containing protein [Tanacetum cinerariifolium]